MIPASPTAPTGRSTHSGTTDAARDAAAAPDPARENRDALAKMVLDAGYVGTFEWHIPDDRLELSPEFERLYDLPPGTIGHSVRHWAEHVHPDDVASVVARVQRSMARHEDGCAFEFRARLPSGGCRWLAGRVRFTYDADGTPLRMIGVNSDIDARRQIEIARRDSDAWFRRLADALPIIVWTATTDGVVDFLNEPWRRYTGSAEIAEWERAVHPDDVPPLRAGWREAVSTRVPYQARCRLRRADDGAWRWHALHAAPIEEPPGLVFRWLGTLIDDHDARRLIERNQALEASEQRARQAADDAGRMKDEFLATLGHELRTPLNAITGWTSLLKRGGLSDADAGRAIEVIERSALTQRHLIDQLLDVSRIISGHVRLDLQPVFLEDVVAHAVEAARPLADARGLHLAATLQPSREPLLGDPARLQQALTNLLDNAVKFNKDGGQIAVTLDRVGNRMHLRVADTGAGIPPAFLPHVFDRSRHAESPNARRFGGLGLGLSIVKQIVQMHGGEVTAASAGEGLGAEFTIALGLGAAAGRPAAGPSPRADGGTTSPLRGLSILIIEDDSDSREMLSVLLENAGAVPVPAASVAEALRLLGDLEVDVVLSDIGMPDRDGFDLIRALRDFPNPRVRHAPAVAVTAFARREDRERILAAGFDAHVSKPVEPLDLFRTVTDVRQRRAGND